MLVTGSVTSRFRLGDRACTAAVQHEFAFEMAGASVRFGAGVTREVGMDLVDLGATRALVVTDPIVARLDPMTTTLESLAEAGVTAVVFDRVRVEPTDVSFQEAIDFAAGHAIDAIVAVGGGSVIDTAKAVNLYTTYPPADFLDYVNAPIGKAQPVPGPLKPLIAIPTTAGTGSETTGVSIFDLTALHAKTGIASRRLKPTLGLLDPDNTRTMPPQVAASSGLDILSHAIESFTALPYAARPRPERPLAAPGLPGLESDQRRLVAAGAADGGRLPGAGRRGSRRRRGPRADAAGGVVCRRRLRQRRRAPAARHVVPGVGPGEGLPRPGLRQPTTRWSRTACR